jgi:transposase
MKGTVLPLEGLDAKEQKRLMVLNRMVGGMGLSVRQVRRLLARYRKEGAAALAHGNRGRSPYNKLDDGVRARVADLAGFKYGGFNTQHLSEIMAEREVITLHSATDSAAIRHEQSQEETSASTP